MLSCCITETTLGIIIGSMFTLLGVIANGLITFVMSRSAHDSEVEERKRCEQKKDADEKKTKREKAYRDFANCYGFMNLLIGFASASKSSQVNGTIFGEVFAEKFKENLSRLAEVMTEVALYGSDVIIEKCGRYSTIWNAASQKQEALSVEELSVLDQELLLVVNEMKKELGFDSL